MAPCDWKALVSYKIFHVREGCTYYRLSISTVYTVKEPRSTHKFVDSQEINFGKRVVDLEDLVKCVRTGFVD
jgi:hypothetical protein